MGLYALRIALGSLWAYRLRSFLTALGVLIGVATVLAIDGIIEGLNTSFKEQLASLGTGTLYVSRRPWLIMGDWWKYMGRPRVTRQDAEYLEAHLTLASAVVPFADERGTVHGGGADLPGVRIIGSVEGWPEMSGIQPKQGRFISPADVEAARPVAAVGADVMDALAKEGVALGDSIKIRGWPIQVIGVMPARGRIFGQSQDDFVVIPISLHGRLFGTGGSLNIGVVVDPDKLDQGSDEIIGAMRTRRRLEGDQEDTFSINQQQVFVEFYKKITRSLYATAVGLGFVTLIVGGVGIMNIMLVAVAERTQEIGIRKALGARPSTILSQFLVEAALVSGVGGVMGTMIGLMLAKLVASVTPLPAVVPPGVAGIGIGFGVLVGVLFGFLPAYRAARLAPVIALRSD